MQPNDRPEGHSEDSYSHAANELVTNPNLSRQQRHLYCEVIFVEGADPDNPIPYVADAESIEATITEHLTQHIALPGIIFQGASDEQVPPVEDPRPVEKSQPPRHTNEELVELFRDGHPAALERIVKQNSGLVVDVIRKDSIIQLLLQQTATADFDDCLQEGLIGLIDASAQYRAGDALFSTYARAVVQRRILKFLDEYTHPLFRLPIYVRSNTNHRKFREIGKFDDTNVAIARALRTARDTKSLDTVPIDAIANDSGNNPDEYVSFARRGKDKGRVVRANMPYIASVTTENEGDDIDVAGQEIDDVDFAERLLGSLDSSRNRAILERRFGMHESDPLTLEETGVEFGVTRERIRQIEAKTLAQLRYRAWHIKSIPVSSQRFRGILLNPSVDIPFDEPEKEFASRILDEISASLASQATRSELPELAYLLRSLHIMSRVPELQTPIERLNQKLTSLSTKIAPSGQAAGATFWSAAKINSAGPKTLLKGVVDEETGNNQSLNEIVNRLPLDNKVTTWIGSDGQLAAKIEGRVKEYSRVESRSELIMKNNFVTSVERLRDQGVELATLRQMVAEFVRHYGQRH